MWNVDFHVKRRTEPVLRTTLSGFGLHGLLWRTYPPARTIEPTHQQEPLSHSGKADW